MQAATLAVAAVFLIAVAVLLSRRRGPCLYGLASLRSLQRLRMGVHPAGWTPAGWTGATPVSQHEEDEAEMQTVFDASANQRKQE